MESLVYKDTEGNSITLTDRPYILNVLDGADGLKNDLYTTKGLGQDGYTITDKTVQKRALSLKGYILAENTEDVEIYKRRLLTMFNPKNKGSFVYSFGDMSKKIDVEVETGPIFSKDVTARTQNYIVNLIAPDPYWRDTIDNKTDIALWRGKFNFPLFIPKAKGIIMGVREPSLIANINNPGDIETGMLIEFRAKATVVNPSLFNINTREYIKINKTMAAGEVIKINTNYGNKKITSNTNGVETDILNLLDITSTFLQLAKGDNLLRYDADTGLDNLEISIYNTPGYVGV